MENNKTFSILRLVAKIVTIVSMALGFYLVLPIIFGAITLRYIEKLEDEKCERNVTKSILATIFVNVFVGGVLLVDCFVIGKVKPPTVRQIFKWIVYSLNILFLFLYVFSIPAFSNRVPWYFVSYLFMGGLTVVSIVYTIVFSRFKFNKWLIVPCSFVLFSAVGTLLYSHEYRRWLTLILMLVTFFVFYLSFCSIGNNRLVFKLLVFAFLLFGFYFMFVYRYNIIHLQISGARLGGYFDNVNTIGFYFAIAYTISLYIALFFNRKIELLYILFAGLFFVLGFFTGSRAFLVAVAAGSVILMYYRLKKHKIIFFVLFAVLIASYFVMLRIPRLAFLKDQFDRTIYTLFGIGNSKVDTSTIQRAVWPGYAFYLAGRNAIFGYGCNGFAIFSGVGTYAHNNYAEVLCDFGIIGFALFHACYLLPVIMSFKSKDKIFYFVPILAVVFLARNLFGVTYYTKESYLILALLFFITKDSHLPILGKKNVQRKELADCYHEAQI